MNAMRSRNAAGSIFARILREPTFHFVLLAAVLFAVGAAVESRNGNVIEIDHGEVAWRVQQTEQYRGVPLTADQRRQVEESYIDKRVLVREALALGLEDDDRIHDILVQKMLHVLSGDVIQPTDAELRTYYEANWMRYASELTVTADEIVLVTTDPRQAALSEQLRSGVSPEQVAGAVPSRRGVLHEVTPAELGNRFGPVTAGLIFSAKPGEWVGPHEAGQNQHWFRVTGRTESSPLPLEAVRETVRLDWIGETEDERLDRRLDDLRSRYSIIFTGVGSVR